MQPLSSGLLLVGNQLSGSCALVVIKKHPMGGRRGLQQTRCHVLDPLSSVAHCQASLGQAGHWEEMMKNPKGRASWCEGKGSRTRCVTRERSARLRLGVKAGVSWGVGGRAEIEMVKTTCLFWFIILIDKNGLTPTKLYEEICVIRVIIYLDL